MTDDPARRQPDAHAARRAARHDLRETRRAERQARSGERRARRGEAIGPEVRSPLTSERIADAALAVIDREGIEALTVRRLAAELGIGVMTVYWYVRDKEELLDLVKGRIIGEAEVPSAALPWRERLVVGATNVRRAMLAHPAAASLVATRPSMGPSEALLLESLMTTLAEGGLDDQAIADATSLIGTYVTGEVVWEAAYRMQANGPSPAQRAAIDQADRFVRSLDADRFPNLRRLAPLYFAPGMDARFELGLRAIVDGLTRGGARPA